MTGDGHWYYDDGASERGPLELSTLAQMRDAGLVSGDTRVRSVTEESWRTLDQAMAQVEPDAPQSRTTVVQEAADAASATPNLPPVPRYFLTTGDDKAEGPYTTAQLVEVARAMRLPAGAMVARDGDSEWRPVEAVVGLVKGATAPSSPVHSGESFEGDVKNLMSALSGLPHLDGFRWGMLFRGAFDWGGGKGIDERFNAGCRLTTPPVQEVDAGWPTPWAFPRILIIGLLMTAGLAVMWHLFENPSGLPGLIIAGAFAVPAACLALFFEMNVLRNVSMTKVSYLVAAGGVLSLLVSLVLYKVFKVFPLGTFLGATSAGIIEEAGKLLAVMLLIGGAKRFGWTLNGILFGAAIGTGFAGFETAGYVFVAMLDSGEPGGNFYSTLIQRAVFAPFCHVVWSATVAGALWRVKRDGSPWLHLGDRRFWRVLLIVMGLHMLWNSPFNFIEVGGLVGRISAAISILGSWYLVMMLVQEGLNEVRATQAKPNRTEGSP